MIRRVYLVPGFFGFAALGELRYFHFVKETLDEAFRRFGVDVQVHRVDTLPTAAIARRSQRLLEILRETSGDEGEIHLVGHSTGALDARLLMDPHREHEDDRALLQRVRSVVSVSGAHRGSPLASAFKTAFGKELMKLVALMTIRTLKMGPLPVAIVGGLAAVLAAFDSAVGSKPDLVDQLQQSLLADLDADRRVALHQLFQDVATDQALLDELTPELAAHFDASTFDRPGVRYACVVTEARRPSLGTSLEAGLSPYAQASHTLYHAMYRLAARTPVSIPPPPELAQYADRLEAMLGDLPTREDNDGIVPTLSQLHGPVLRAVMADHHDVIGHFDEAHHDPPHVDWLNTGTGFTRQQFEALWTDVAAFILDDRGTLIPQPA
ncbi:MAG: triacylglycerol lipase [Deltaproteobacteria bacterium]|nr:triacylglycerol lipase [Deltaproteobacteria bacterium]